jgi:NAD(P)-dependent dehydrogenase (short-subunit alcohol dehydrogenase family)
MTERCVIVTGASGNVGAAVARALLARGDRVVLLDRHVDKLEQAFAAELAAGHLAFGVDLSDEAACVDTVRRVVSARGRVDGLVNTVGGYLGGSPVVDTDWAAFERMITLNVRVAHAVTRAVLAPMLSQRAGSIVHVASLAGLAGAAGESAYAGAKAALLRLVESLANEVKASGVRVNAVLPGTIDTPQNRAWMSPEQASLAIAPAAIADVVAFLCSDGARAVTGASLKITGAQ